MGATGVGGDIQTLNKLKAFGLSDNAEGAAQLAMFERNGLLSKTMAEAANKNWAKEAGVDYKPGVGPYREGMKADDYGVNDKGGLMINRASMTEDGIKTTIDHGTVTKEYSGKADQVAKLQKEIASKPELSRDFGIAANDLKPGMAITERRDYQGNLIDFNGIRGGKTKKEDIAETDIGQRHTDMDKHDHVIASREEADITNKMLQAKGIKNVQAHEGDTVSMTGKSGSIGEGKNYLKHTKPEDLSFVGVKNGATGEYKDLTIVRKGTDTDIGDHTSNGNTASYHLGADNIRGGGFKVGGMNFVAGNVQQNGDEYTISGTNHLGYHVEMKGRSRDGLLRDTEGKFTSIPDFEVTDIQKVKRDDTLVSNTYTDRNKLTIDQQDDISMSNLNKIRTHYGESPEEFVRNHQDIIAAYGVGKNVLENFKEIMGGVRTAKDTAKIGEGWGGSPKTPPKVRFPKIEGAKGAYSDWYPGIMD